MDINFQLVMYKGQMIETVFWIMLITIDNSV